MGGHQCSYYKAERRPNIYRLSYVAIPRSIQSRERVHTRWSFFNNNLQRIAFDRPDVFRFLIKIDYYVCARTTHVENIAEVIRLVSVIDRAWLKRERRVFFAHPS